MAKGNSGRIVIEIDPDFKRSLYSVLAADGLTLKEWFIQAAERHVNERSSYAQGVSVQVVAGAVKK
ncbi:hypothetical protein [Pseudomonas sp. F3-2]|uniref:hypothetical protein n=1 Tax=Pseudomonas sp. F3-2 TaxID=3141539 RepID=UPI00315D4F32